MKRYFFIFHYSAGLFLIFVILILTVVIVLKKSPQSTLLTLLPQQTYKSSTIFPLDHFIFAPPPILDGVLFHGPRSKKIIALTFDADMTTGMKEMLENGIVGSYYDRGLINYLEKSNTPATLFLTGLWAETYPDETRSLAQNALFEIGSHSYVHEAYSLPCFSLTGLSTTGKIEDIGASQMMLSKLIGRSINLFRFPGGCYQKDDISLLKIAGLLPVQWDVVANDGFNSNPDTIISNVLSHVKNGSIIVMHMNGFPNEPVDDTVVPEIVQILKQKGYQFVTVSQLIGR